MHILHDNDLLSPEPQMTASNGLTTEALTFGFTCDLFLTSLCLFEYKIGALSAIKESILRKWLRLTKVSDVQSMVSMFFRGASFNSEYIQLLREEINNVKMVALNNEDGQHNMVHAVHQQFCNGSLDGAHSQSSIDLVPKYPKCYRALHIQPLNPREIEATVPAISSPIVTGDFPTCISIHNDSTLDELSTPFASNSSCSYVQILTSADSEWRQAFIKEASSTDAELAALSAVQRYFPKESVLTVLAAEPGKRLYLDPFDGVMLNEVRLRYQQSNIAIEYDSVGKHYPSDEWFINIEVRRARDVLAAYVSSWISASTSTHFAQQSINTFLLHRLIEDPCLLQPPKESSTAAFTPSTPGRVNLHEILTMPIFINGHRLGPL